MFVDGALVAVFSYLQETIDGDLANHWFLEAGFGRCEVKEPPLFNTQYEAQQWVLERYRGR